MLRIGEKIDKYEIVAVLGSGAFGMVYLVEWKSKKGKYSQGALKILKNPKNRNVVREAITWARVSHHKNVLTFLDAPEHGDQLLLLSEYAPNGSLQDWITNHGGSEQKYESAVDLMCGILEGLAHLHEHNVIHRDIKPQNILLNAETPLLADFGLSRELELSQSSMLAGTLFYMSPDLFNAFLTQNLAADKYERTEADDLWAISVTFYQMVTGFFPFVYPMQISSANPFELSDKLPENLRDFLARALNKDKNERFETAAAMREALRPTVKPVEPPKETAKPLLSPKDYVERATRHLKKGEYEKAIVLCDIAIEHDGRLARAYLIRGLAYCEKDNPARGIKDYTKAIELNPNFADAFNNRAIALDEQTKYDQAIKDYNRAIELNPDYSEAFNNRGFTYDNKKDYDRALKDYDRAIELNPDFITAYENRALTYDKIGETEKAKADRKKAAELEKES